MSVFVMEVRDLCLLLTLWIKKKNVLLLRMADVYALHEFLMQSFIYCLFPTVSSKLLTEVSLSL